MKIRNELDQFGDALEKFVFQKEELKELGKLITQLQNGDCAPKELKAKILESRARILKDVREFSNFYISHILASSRTNKTSNDHLIRELEQKNSLLGYVAKKLQKMTTLHQTNDTSNACSTE